MAPFGLRTARRRCALKQSFFYCCDKGIRESCPGKGRLLKKILRLVQGKAKHETSIVWEGRGARFEMKSW